MLHRSELGGNLRQGEYLKRNLVADMESPATNPCNLRHAYVSKHIVPEMIPRHLPYQCTGR
jgi:hypothetical protein